MSYEFEVSKRPKNVKSLLSYIGSRDFDSRTQNAKSASSLTRIGRMVLKILLGFFNLNP